MSKVKYYAVAKGLTDNSVGIYTTWNECEKHIKGVSNAKYKSFKTKEEAIEYIKENNPKAKYISSISSNKSNKKKAKVKTKKVISNKKPEEPFIKELTEALKEETDSYREPNYIRSKATDIIVKEEYEEPEEKVKEEVAVYFVDGSYNKNIKVYGSGIVELYQQEDEERNKEIVTRGYIASGIDYWDQWNIIGEIEASKCAIVDAYRNKKKKVIIYHDLTGTARWACGKYKAKNIYTKSYVEFIEEYNNKLEIEFIKVKGHSDNKYNDMADEYAKRAIIDYMNNR